MSEVYITRRGGSNSINSVLNSSYGAIAVTYPENSVCTCSNGQSTFIAGDTSGLWIFLVPSAGSWTVTATQGSDSSTKTATITGLHQCEKIELTFSQQFVANGYITNLSTFVGSHPYYTQSQNTNPDFYRFQIAQTGWHCVYTANPIIIKHPTYHIKLQNGSNGYQNLAIWSKSVTPDFNNPAAQFAIPKNATEATLDVSSFIGHECYIGFSSTGGLGQDLIIMELCDGGD